MQLRRIGTEVEQGGCGWDGRRDRGVSGLARPLLIAKVLYTIKELMVPWSAMITWSVTFALEEFRNIM